VKKKNRTFEVERLKPGHREDIQIYSDFMKHIAEVVVKEIKKNSLIRTYMFDYYDDAFIDDIGMSIRQRIHQDKTLRCVFDWDEIAKKEIDRLLK